MPEEYSTPPGPAETLEFAPVRRPAVGIPVAFMLGGGIVTLLMLAVTATCSNVTAPSYVGAFGAVANGILCSWLIASGRP